MIVEALRLADDHIFIPGRPTEEELTVQTYDNGIAMRRMSECAKDFHAYWRLTEYVLRMIEHSVDPVSSLFFLSHSRNIIYVIVVLLEITTREGHHHTHSNTHVISVYRRNHRHE